MTVDFGGQKTLQAFRWTSGSAVAQSRALAQPFADGKTISVQTSDVRKTRVLSWFDQTGGKAENNDAKGFAIESPMPER